jgi:Domain of unknown function (DUF4386)
VGFGPREAEVTDLALGSNAPTPATSPLTLPGSLNKTTARIAGVLYLLVGIFGGFAEGFVEPKVYVAGDAATSVANVVSNAALVRAGVVADLLDQAFFVLLAVTLYGLLKNVQRNVAVAMVALVAVAAAIASLNVVFLFEALQVSGGGSYLKAVGTAGAEATVLMLLDLQHYGLLAAQVFFGLWLAPLGYLALKSGQFSKALGIVLIVAAGCYMVDLLAAFLVPDLSKVIHAYVVIPCALAEIWMVLYLLVIGVRTPGKREAAAGAKSSPEPAV